jgi:hypothetical protein
MLNVFISWSGNRSLKAATILEKYIRVFLQGATPFISTDIKSGQRWFDVISNRLESSSFGILCVTKANLKSPWLHFEAGALSKHHRDSSVCVFLLDAKQSELEKPLSEYQATSLTADDVLRLFKTINSRIDELKREEQDLTAGFAIIWPTLYAELEEVVNAEDSTEPTPPNRSTESIIDEVLTNTRQILDRIPDGHELPPNINAFEYIPGEAKAMQALIDATMRAQRHIRATRFFPHDIKGTFPEYAKAIAARVLGIECQPLEHYFRIVAANKMEKLNDIEEYLHRFQGRPFTLYLTSFSNDFELVVIDDAEVFIHFYGHELVIESTIRLKGHEIAERFLRIFSRLHDPKKGAVEKFECRYTNEGNLNSFIARAKSFFQTHAKEKIESSEDLIAGREQETTSAEGGAVIN